MDSSAKWTGRRVIVASAACTLLACLCGCAASPDAEARSWTSLFNGSDLTGWTVKCKPADAEKGFWRVDDGTLLADSLGHKGHDYVWLVTSDEYSDFILRLEFQAYRDSPGNSGVQLRSRYDDEAGWLDGPQVDIHPTGPWRTGMIWDETRDARGWLYPRVPKGQWVDPSMAPSGLAFYYAGDEPAWNTLQIQAVGPRVTALLNGAVVTDYDGAGVLDDAIHTARRVGMKGHIALQIHSNDQLKIRFRNIVIKSPAE